MTDETKYPTTEKAEKKAKSRRVGQIITRGENKHLIRIFRGYKPNGSNDYFNKTFHGTKKDAEKWLRGALARRDRGEPLEDPDITFSALFDEWLTSKKRKSRTQEIYRETFGYYIKPKWGETRISAITAREVQKWINGVREKYGAGTTRLAFAVFRSAIRYALGHEMLLKNPLSLVEIPPKKKRKANVLEPAEALKVLDACRAEPGGIFCAFLLWAGTRPNEAAALQWKDVDWERGAVTIRRNVVRLRGGKWEFADPKTTDSVRSFTLPASFMAWLKEHRQNQLEQRMRLGRNWADYDLVFPNEVGEPVPDATFRGQWKRILAKAGMTAERMKMRAYDARHTVATLLLMKRVPTKIVSARLGHASTAITEDVYSHVLESMQDQATDDLEAAILGGRKEGKKS
jgi:integrase